MDRYKYQLKSNEAYNLITNAIAQNRKVKDGKLLTPSEVEELVYYLLKDIYKDKYIRLTNDNENELQRIIDQLRYGDIVIRLPKEDINIEVKSEKPYKGLYKLRIDLEYDKIQSNTGDYLGWYIHLLSYDKIYVHFHDTTNKYKSTVFVINNPYQLMLDIKGLIFSGELEYNKPYLYNGVYFEVFRNPIDGYKTTTGISFNLLDYEARERYDIDIIYLEVQMELEP